MDVRKQDFKEGFKFGVATAAYQIEGHKFGGAGPTIWDKFAHEGGVVRGENGDVACDHYHRFGEDLDLVQRGNFDAYRFSFSWSRVMPNGRQINQEGLDFYSKLIDAQLERGLLPFGTAYHWDMPLELGEAGGWTSRDTTARFADYAHILSRNFGDRLASIATINEPWCVAWLSYFHGHHAPGVRDLGAAARAMHHILLAHGRGVEAMRAETDIAMGIVLNFEPGYPAGDSAADQAATDRHNAIYNEWFIDAVTGREYPQAAMDGIEPHLPENWQADMPLISSDLDFVGINYYTRKLIAATDGSFPALVEVDGGLPKTDMGWEISAPSLGDVIEDVAAKTNGIDIYITENGMAAASGINDLDRMQYLNDHLVVVAEKSQSLPVKGYFAWSLLDNFEWAFGYDKRFGLVHVDYETQERTPKASFDAFAKMLG